MGKSSVSTVAGWVLTILASAVFCLSAAMKFGAIPGASDVRPLGLAGKRLDSAGAAGVRLRAALPYPPRGGPGRVILTAISGPPSRPTCALGNLSTCTVAIGWPSGAACTCGSRGFGRSCPCGNRRIGIPKPWRVLALKAFE